MYWGKRPFLVLLITALAILGTLPPGAVATPAVSGESDNPRAIDGDGPTFQLEGTDAELNSGTTYWQGWELQVNAAGIIDGDNTDIEVWAVTDDGELRQRVATAITDEDGIAVIDTGDLDGRYVLRYTDQPVYVESGTAHLDSPPDGSAVTVETSTFGVERQTFSLDWSDPEVFPGQATALTATSNRDQFTAVVSGDGLSFQNLTTLVPDSAYATDFDATAEDDRLRIEIDTGSPLRLNTSSLAPGEQQLRFSALDTTVRSHSTLTVKEPASDRRFISVERHDHVGDVLDVELDCTHCYLAVGTPEQGVVDLVELNDGDGDDRVTLRINTRYAGQYTGASGFPDDIRPYTSPTDDVRRYSSGDTLEQVDEELSYTVTTIGELRDRLGLSATSLNRPIDSGPLQLTVAETDFLIVRSAYGSGPPHGSNMVVRDETDARTVELQPRSLDGVHPMAAPDGSGEITADQLRSEAGPREQVALGDRLVFRIDASGVFGYLQDHDVAVETLAGNDAEGIDLSLVQRSDGTEEELQLDQVDIQLVPDPARDHLYLVMGTGGPRSDYLQSGEYRLTFSLDGVAATNNRYSTSTAHDGYPYLQPGARETVSATVTLDPPAASITEPMVGDSPRLTADSRLAIEGAATVASGARLQVHVASTEFAWDNSVRATVNATGHWEVAVNLADAPGDEFDVAVSRGDDVLDEGTYTVRPPAENGSDGPNGSDGGDGGAGDGGALPDVGDGGDSFIPGVPNLVIYGGGFLVVIFVIFVSRAFG